MTGCFFFFLSGGQEDGCKLTVLNSCLFTLKIIYFSSS